ncbi:periplasmic binding protein [Listeria floridensis FSL S10-1187]|uniref:Periplasmic binding protein n=1 Tax=Listeria floridensis FSL S10-1187 TaxID=1265817 RepID=A0ABP3AXC3_9LIST|nr:siderophore ABC transporter substrate-binding protein [Listeria floridensis]EUJ31248.1 periplasmic binding protein [Listeria floridensis FSL S10-1187]
MKKLAASLGVILLAIGLVACGESGDKKERVKADSKEITVKHELGKTTVKQNPEKVTVFDFGTLDTLEKLGLSSKVAALPKQNLPKYLKAFDTDKAVDAGGLKEPDFEAINNAGSDLNIISGRQSDSYDKFSEIAPTIYLGLDTSNYLDSFHANVKTIGKIFNKEKEAEAELDKIDSQIKEVKDAAPKDKTGLIILANDGKISAYGSGSRFGLIHDVLGVKPVDMSIKASTHGQSISMEYISEKNPDYIYVIDRGAAVGGESSAKKTVENDLVKTTNAYKTGKIIYLNPEYWYLSGGGLESVSEMVKEIGDSF